MKAIIAGGGIGGMTAALCLEHLGWQVEVCEAAGALTEIGAGIQLSPNAMKVYQALGLEPAISRLAFEPEGIELRMGESGRRLIRTPLADTARERYGAPYLHIHRADLMSVLLGAVTERRGAALQLGAQVAGYTQSAEHVVATLTDGRTISGNVLVGADGVHSQIRTQMLGPDKPVFTGNVAWRAVIPVGALGADAPPPLACAWMGRGKHAVTYLLRGGQLANFVGVVERDDWTEESWSLAGETQDALADFAGWHRIIVNMIESAGTLYRWALFDRPPLATWTDGRVALLGDAAHPMLPFMAQGAAMAIEDGWALAATLGQGDRGTGAELSGRLQAYEDLRLPRASRVQAGSRANAKTFHQRTRLGQLRTYGPMWLAGRIAPQIGLMRQDNLYNYDVTKTA